MNNMTSEQLLTHLDDAESTLTTLPGQIDSSPDLQRSITSIMEAGDDAVEAFEQLVSGNRTLANQVLMSSVAVMTSQLCLCVLASPSVACQGKYYGPQAQQGDAGRLRDGGGCDAILSDTSGVLRQELNVTSRKVAAVRRVDVAIAS